VTPSDRSRERTLARLRDGYAGGILGTETFDDRVDVALRARTEDELAGLTLDLPAAAPWRQRLGRELRGWLRPEPGPGPEPAPPPLPAGGLLAVAELGTGELTLGRSSRSHIVLADRTVSRRHAALRRREGRWYLVDLGSTNGTWVEDRRVFDAEVRPGDEIRLGQVGLRL